MSNKSYIGDIGTEIIVDCGSVITGATNLKLEIRKPDGTLVEWIPTIHLTNYLKYTVVTGDFDQAGTYLLQSSLSINGWSGLGETALFVVYNPFE